MHFFGHGYCKYWLKDKCCLSNPSSWLLLKRCCPSQGFFLLRFHAAEETKDDQIGQGLRALWRVGIQTCLQSPSASRGFIPWEQVTACHSHVEGRCGSNLKTHGIWCIQCGIQLVKRPSSVGPVGQQTKDRLDPAWQSARFRRLNHVCDMSINVAMSIYVYNMIIYDYILLVWQTSNAHINVGNILQYSNF